MHCGLAGHQDLDRLELESAVPDLADHRPRTDLPEPDLATVLRDRRLGQSAYGLGREPLQAVEHLVPHLDLLAEFLDRNPRLGIVGGEFAADDPIDPEHEVRHASLVEVDGELPVQKKDVAAAATTPMLVDVSCAAMDGLPDPRVYGGALSGGAHRVSVPARDDVEDHGLLVLHPLYALVNHLRCRDGPRHPALRRVVGRP
mmetsp:Transcript_123229/g.356009  ORF Transcript_123229/g.356009 Transcript_123229/m.356009 type:complete len:201 (+) Transcript_123229:393-995(+)